MDKQSKIGSKYFTSPTTETAGETLSGTALLVAGPPAALDPTIAFTTRGCQWKNKIYQYRLIGITSQVVAVTYLEINLGRHCLCWSSDGFKSSCLSPTLKCTK